MKFRLSPAVCRFAACGLVLLAVVRIVATYHVFNQTIDEPVHLACGMEWLANGTYFRDTEDPVLSRIAIAIGPYLEGARPSNLSNRFAAGNAILYGGGHYFRTLALARAGILPFFLLACIVLWLWTRRWYGEAEALAALFVFTTVPPVLAHAGLATTDMAGTACLLAALYSFTCWLQEPSRERSLLLGVCIALALLAKLSAALFLPLCMMAIFILYSIAERPSAADLSRRLRSLWPVVVLVPLLIWTGYRFSFGPLPEHDYFATQPPVTIARYIGGHSIPAPEFFDGIAAVQLHNYQGHPAWCLSKYSETGFWYFFPVALTVKTPLAMMVLVILGIGITYEKLLGQRSQSTAKRFAWQPWVPLLCATVIFISVIPTHINIGVRHVLILYPLLAIVAGVAAATLLRHGTKAPLLVAATLLLWQGYVSLRAHPDYLAYFNEFVRGDPAQVLADSDLDWGQDLQRLSNKLKEVGAKKVTLVYFGTADVTKHGLPPTQDAPSYHPTTGWVAVSVYARTIGRAEMHTDQANPPLGWLDSYRPVTRVGKSIDLYYIPPK